MKDFIEHYGMGALSMLGELIMFAIIFACMASGGALNNAVMAFMQSICG